MKKGLFIIALISALFVNTMVVFASEIPEDYAEDTTFSSNFTFSLSDGTKVPLVRSQNGDEYDGDDLVAYLGRELKSSDVLKLTVIDSTASFNPDEFYVDGEKTSVSQDENGNYILTLPDDYMRIKVSYKPNPMFPMPMDLTFKVYVVYAEPSSEVIGLIDAIPDNITVSDKDAVVAARAAYDSLSEDDKAKVTNYEKLVAAEARILNLEKAAEFDEAVGTLPDLDNLTEDDYEKIASIKEKYDALTNEQQKLVSNEAALKLAFEKLAVKKLQDELNEAKDALNEALENETPESDINKLVEGVKQTKKDLKDAKDKLAAAEATLKVKSTVIKKVRAKAQKKKATVSWKSAGKGYKYEIYTSKKVSKGYKKAATVSKVKTVVKKLKSKKTYYVKVRGFKTVNGKKVYTQYSDVVSVKIK